MIAAIQAWNRRRLIRRRAWRRELPTLAVMGIVKNEGRNIDEWIEHYLWQGAAKVFVIDNGSTDDTVARLEHWAALGHVEHLRREERYVQREHYRAAFRAFRIADRFQWLLVADADEFWWSRDGRSIADRLPELSGLDVIYASWSNFGSSGHVAHPDSLRARLVHRAPERDPEYWNTKWIARTSILSKLPNAIEVHRVRGGCSSRTAAMDGHFQINHYVTQSLEYWQQVKMTRGDATEKAKNSLRDMAYFDRIERSATMRDTGLADRVARATGRADRSVG